MKLRLLLFAALFALPLHAATIRELYVEGDQDALIDTFRKLPSPSIEERALAAVTYATWSMNAAAERELATLRAIAPGSAWTSFVAAAIPENLDRMTEAVAASEQMMRRAGPDPDDELVRYRAYVLLRMERYDEAIALLDSRPQTPRIRARRAMVLRQKGDVAEAEAILARLRADEPAYVEAWTEPARHHFSRRRALEAYPLLKTAVTLTTNPRIHSLYWQAIDAQEITDAQKQEERERDIASLREKRDDPALWLALADDAAQRKNWTAAAEWNERVIAEAPHTFRAGRAMVTRYSHFARQNPTLRDDAKLRAEARRMLREALAYPVDDEDYSRSNARMSLYGLAKADPGLSAEEIVAAVEGIRDTFSWQPALAADAATLLADRGIRLDLAEELARSGFDHTKKWFLTGDDADDYRNTVQASMHDALGWVLLQKGDLALARNQLFAAYEMNPRSPTIIHHLGRWYEAQNLHAKAEERYREGAALSSSVNPNEAALRALYEKRHGNLTGFESYRKSTERKTSIARRDRILGSRKANPNPAPDFRLRNLDGREISLASLKGRTIVINFWGIWCAWCVKELPDYQKLAKKYAADSSVAILTINNDGDAKKVRKWMDGNQYDFPVLMDDGFVQKSKVTAFPTTWFIDRAGRLAFEQRGWTSKLVEEFSWRIEALRAR